MSEAPKSSLNTRKYRLNASVNTLKQIQGASNTSLCLFSPGKLSKMQLSWRVTTSRETSGGERNDRNTSGQRRNKFSTSFRDILVVVAENNSVVKPKC